MDEIRLDAASNGDESQAAPQQTHTWGSRLSDFVTRLADVADSAGEATNSSENWFVSRSTIETTLYLTVLACIS
jgi:hypothetical protein